MSASQCKGAQSDILELFELDIHCFTGHPITFLLISMDIMVRIDHKMKEMWGKKNEKSKIQ